MRTMALKIEGQWSRFQALQGSAKRWGLGSVNSHPGSGCSLAKSHAFLPISVYIIILENLSL